MKRKEQQRAAIKARAERALGDLYHNATPRYPSSMDDDEAARFQSWFEGAAEFEIDYLRDGGAYGRDYLAALKSAVGTKGYLKLAEGRYIGWQMRKMNEERARCNSLDSREHNTNALWECIGDYGTLYQYGRGGRTLAPDDLISMRGGSSFSIRESYCDDLNLADTVRLILVVESFNRYVNDWCNSVPEQWREVEAERIREEKAERRAAIAAKAKETRERHYWEARGVITV